jgi:hypothetical protein
MKQQALDREDYTTAEQIRNKINIIQLQLDKMDDQFSTDMLQNIITQWQLELLHCINNSSPTKVPIAYEASRNQYFVPRIS